MGHLSDPFINTRLSGVITIEISGFSAALREQIHSR